MSAELDVHNVETQHGFAEKRGGQLPAHAQGARELPWKALLDALHDGDVELARRHYRQLMARHPDLKRPPFFEVGTLLASANLSAALQLLEDQHKAAPASAPHASPPDRLDYRPCLPLSEMIGVQVDEQA